VPKPFSKCRNECIFEGEATSKQDLRGGGVTKYSKGRGGREGFLQGTGRGREPWVVKWEWGRTCFDWSQQNYLRGRKESKEEGTRGSLRWRGWLASIILPRTDQRNNHKDAKGKQSSTPSPALGGKGRTSMNFINHLRRVSGLRPECRRLTRGPRLKKGPSCVGALPQGGITRRKFKIFCNAIWGQEQFVDPSGVEREKK